MTTIRKIGTLVRDAWLIVGIALLLFCALEGSLSLVFFIKKAGLSGPGLSAGDRRILADTYSGQTWVPAYYEEFHRSFRARWRAYVYWRREPFQGNHININNNGLRLTVSTEPMPKRSRAPFRIFMFGGSALWGTGARDAFTIPSILAKELRNKGVAAEVTNFGESGYVSTQEVIALLLELQKGARPDVVVFYDGVNDMFSAFQQRVAGLPQNEYNREKEFNLSQPARLKQQEGMVLQNLSRSLYTPRFVRAFLRKTGIWREPAAALDLSPIGDRVPQGEALAQDVLAIYRANIEAVETLSKDYHFKYVFYWQPTIFQKAHLTAFERGQRAAVPALEQFARRTHELKRQSGLSEGGGSSFHDLSLVFADVREPVFVDWCHLGESGNESIAKRMMSDVLALAGAST